MSKIIDIPIEERPRERAIKYGIESLSNPELYALLISSGGISNSAIDIANEIFRRECSLINVVKMKANDLKKIKGISDVKAIQLSAINEIISRYLALLSNMDQEADYKSQIYLRNTDLTERLEILLLDSKLRVRKRKILTIGNKNKTIIDTSYIINYVKDNSFKNFVLIHNHPSGNPYPSLKDEELTLEIEEIAKLFSLKMVDHIILGKDSYYSFRTNEITYSKIID